MPKTSRHRFCSQERIGHVRVWMDAHGVDVVIIGHDSGALVISAAHATECKDHMTMFAAIRLRWRQGRYMVIYGLAPDLSAEMEEEAQQLGVTTRHLAEDLDGRFQF